MGERKKPPATGGEGDEWNIIHECGEERKNRPDNENFLLTIFERIKSLKTLSRR